MLVSRGVHTADQADVAGRQCVRRARISTVCMCVVYRYDPSSSDVFFLISVNGRQVLLVYT